MEQGPRGVDGGAVACSSGRGSLFSRHGGQRPVIKQEAGLGRAGRHLIPSIPLRLWQRWGCGGVGDSSAIPVVSLEMIACPGARREDVLQLHAQDFQEEETSFSTRFFDISLPSGGIYEPRPGDAVQFVDKSIACRVSLEK